ncbi:hypothetical protein [Marivirga sp.]|uniref:hypothetical protein n=1 Tax=Marivirga sp. TaxID=2018662 RepID=UPI002D803AC1|nr:hypothetical protein [Marivirga sp.]HET8860876.1 hypothetical protein [Marivirga sp.]
MQLTNFLLAIFSGLIGTIAMTLVMYSYAAITKKKTKVVHVLGLMVTGNHGFSKERKTIILTTGSITHLLVGVLFSFSYFLLWNWGVFSISTLDSIIVGALSGILAIVGWGAYFKVYSKPPRINLSHYFTALFISHIVFGWVTVNIFRLITDSPQFWYQLQEEINK